MAGALGSSLFGSIFTPTHFASGASSAVCGIVFAHWANILLNWENLKWKPLPIFVWVFYVLWTVDFTSDSVSGLLLEITWNIGVGMLLSKVLLYLLPLPASAFRNKWIRMQHAHPENAELQFNSYLKSEFNFQVSHAGHLGGSFGGFVAAIFFLRVSANHSWVGVARKILGVLSAALILIIICINICSTHSHPTNYTYDYWDIL